MVCRVVDAQNIIRTNAGILLIGHLGGNFNEISNKIHTFLIKKIHLKMLSGKWQPFCLGLNVVTYWPLVKPHDITDMVNIASGNGLVPGGTEPLPQIMLIYRVPLALNWEQKFYWKYLNVKQLNEFKIYKLRITAISSIGWWFNTLRLRPNGPHFADDIFKCIFLNENVLIPIKISMKFVPKGPINNIPALVQIMAWRRPCAKPLSGPMMVCLLTHLCVARPKFSDW